MAAPWSCAVTPSWGPSKSSWSSNSSSICRRNHHHASPRQQRRFPSHPTPCSGDFRDASVDIAHFFTPVEKVGLASVERYLQRCPFVGGSPSLQESGLSGWFWPPVEGISTSACPLFVKHL